MIEYEVIARLHQLLGGLLATDFRLDRLVRSRPPASVRSTPGDTPTNDRLVDSQAEANEALLGPPVDGPHGVCGAAAVSSTAPKQSDHDTFQAFLLGAPAFGLPIPDELIVEPVPSQGDKNAPSQDDQLSPQPSLSLTNAAPAPCDVVQPRTGARHAELEWTYQFPKSFPFVRPDVPAIGMYVGPNPLPGDFSDRPYIWVCPGADKGMSSVWATAQSSLPGRLKRIFLRSLGSAGPGENLSTGVTKPGSISIYWQTCTEMKLRPGDMLVSRVGEVDPVNPAMFLHGDWDLTRVTHIFCKRRRFKLGELRVVEYADIQWQMRMFENDSAAAIGTFNIQHKLVSAGWELTGVRPAVLPRGTSWEDEVMTLQSSTDSATIRLRYEAVIRASPEQHVACLRLHMQAAIKETDMQANPCAQLRKLVQIEALQAARGGRYPAYGLA
jgi:hypothetical protein